MDYAVHILVIVAIYTTLAISLDLLIGQLGLLSVAHAAFFGLGAYTSALITTKLLGSFLFGVIAGILLAASLAVLLSLPSLRLHDDYLVIATFGFQIIMFSIANNWIELTRGPAGIPAIPAPHILGWSVESRQGFLVLAGIVAVSAYLVVRQVAASPFGRALRAIREDEVFARALGKNTLYFKIVAFALSAALAGCAGSLYAHYVTFIDPTGFTVSESILVVSMVVIGGAGSLWGPLAGASLLVVLPEILRILGFPSSVAANLRQIIYGIALVVMMALRPRGLMGGYGFGR
jgi:branched-chain amino acid transport system permease protein